MNRVFMFVFKSAVAHSGEGKVYMVDIDNTLADSWPSLKDGFYTAENQRYRSLSMFIGMRRYLLDVQKDHTVIFISARSYLAYQTTMKWLQDCGLTGCSLILVPGALEKVNFLLELVKRNKSTVFIDDLSYNHEYGEVKRYDLVLYILSRLPITYLGLNEIEQINAAHESDHQDLKKIVKTVSDHPIY